MEGFVRGTGKNGGYYLGLRFPKPYALNPECMCMQAHGSIQQRFYCLGVKA